MGINVEIVNYKTAVWMYKEKTTISNGKKYSVKMLVAPYPLKLTGNLMKFIHGNTIYLVPEYHNNAVNEFIIFKITGKKHFQKTLEKIKSNKAIRKLKTSGKLIDEENNVKLIEFEGKPLIITGNSIYYDRFDKNIIEKLTK